MLLINWIVLWSSPRAGRLAFGLVSHDPARGTLLLGLVASWSWICRGNSISVSSLDMEPRLPAPFLSIVGSDSSCSSSTSIARTLASRCTCRRLMAAWFLSSVKNSVAGSVTGASRRPSRIDACSLPEEDESGWKSRSNKYTPVTMAIP